jgi:hypothetical protein
MAERHLWSAAATSRLPSPEQAKTGTMPTDNRLRLDDHQGIHNARRDPIEAGEASYLLGKSAPEVPVPDGLDAFRTKPAGDPGLFAARYKAGARVAAEILGKPVPEFAR